MQELDDFMQSWQADPCRIKDAFSEYAAIFMNKPDVKTSFVARPGISYSFRGARGSDDPENLLCVIDVIDDDPQNRWLSVCFYASLVTDPQGLGDLAPAGLYGKDALCFNLDEDDALLRRYILERLLEAANAHG